MKTEAEDEDQEQCRIPAKQCDSAATRILLGFIPKVDPSTCAFEKHCHMSQAMISSRRKNQLCTMQKSYNV